MGNNLYGNFYKGVVCGIIMGLYVSEMRKGEIRSRVYDALGISGDGSVVELDSLESVDFVMRLEDMFEIEISDEDYNKIYEGKFLENDFVLNADAVVDYLAGRGDLRL